MEATITRFVLFLLSEILFVLVIAASMIPLGILIIKKSVRSVHLILYPLALIFLSNAFLFLFIWILTSRSYLELFITLTVVHFAAVLLSELLWVFVGSGDQSWFPRTIWSASEFKYVMPRFSKTLEIIAGLMLLVYPVYIGIGYFGAQFGQPGWDLYVFRATLIVLVFTSWLPTLPKNLYLMTSRNVLEQARSRMFVSQLAGAVSMLFYLALLFWTLDKEGSSVSILGSQFIFSTSLMYMIGAYLLVVLVVPYLIGYRRAREWIGNLEAKRIDIVKQLSVKLLEPSIDGVRQSLAAIMHEIRAQTEAIESLHAIKYAREVERSPAQSDLAAHAVLDDAKKHDPRFIHLSALAELLGELDKCQLTIETSRGAGKLKAAKDYAGLFSKKLELLLREQPSAPKARPAIVLVLTAVATPLLNPVLSSVTKYIVQSMGFDAK